MTCALLLNFAFKFYHLQVPETYGDAAYNWLNCKYVSTLNLGWDGWNHHRTRWGMIIPNVLSIWAFGKSLYVYPVANFFYSGLSVVFIALILREGKFKEISWVVSLSLYIFFPPLIRATSQLLPGIYSSTYLLAAIFGLFRYSNNGKVIYLLFSAVAAFMVYESKFTGALFFPGLCISVFLGRRNWRHFLVYSGLLVFLMVVEFSIYRWSSGYEMGRLGIIKGTHITDLTQEVYLFSIYDFFKRYLALRGPWAWCFVSFATVLLLFGFFYKHTNRFHRILILSSLSFYVGLLFVVVDIDPITLGVPYRDRYLIAGLPVIFVALGSFLDISVKKVRNDLQTDPVLFDLRRLHSFFYCILSWVYGHWVLFSRIVDRFRGVIPVIAFVGMVYFSYQSIESIRNYSHAICHVSRSMSVFEKHFFTGMPITGPRKTGLAVRSLFWDRWQGNLGPNQRIGESRLVIGGRKTFFFFDPATFNKKSIDSNGPNPEWRFAYLELLENPTRIVVRKNPVQER